jgi:hypothetical protein
MATNKRLATLTAPGSQNATAMTQGAHAPRGHAWASPVTGLRHLSGLLLGLWLVTGCAPIPPLPFTFPSGSPSSGSPSVLTLTQVHLAQRNYRVVRTNVAGTSQGFALFGLLTLKAPDAIEAFAQLYQAGDVAEGHAFALVNVMQHSSAPFFLLFSLPKITFRADVVEFIDMVPRRLPETPSPRLPE